MANLDKLKQNPKEQLFEHLDDVRAVMLGSPVHHQHMQPMAPQVDKEAGTVWFYTNKSSDLVKALGQDGGEVHLCIVEKDYQACLLGDLTVDHNPQKIDQFWSSVIAAWFEGDKTDPDLTMLCFRTKNGSIWASDKNPITFAWEIAKANHKDQKPDIGERTSVDFH